MLVNYRNYLLGPRSRQFLTDYQVRSVSDVTVDVLRNFQYELLKAGLAPGTADTLRRVMPNFLGLCRREGMGRARGGSHHPCTPPAAGRA
jgi:hypothetical protein